MGLDVGDDVLNQVVLERRSPTAETAAGPAASAATGTRGLAFAADADTCIAVGKDHDQRLDLAVGQHVVEDIIRAAQPLPLAVVAADAVQKEKHGVLAIL